MTTGIRNLILLDRGMAGSERSHRQRRTFIEGDEDEINDKHERQEDGPTEWNHLVLEVHEITDDVIRLHDGENDERVHQKRL